MSSTPTGDGAADIHVTSGGNVAADLEELAGVVELQKRHLLLADLAPFLDQRARNLELDVLESVSCSVAGLSTAAKSMTLGLIRVYVTYPFCVSMSIVSAPTRRRKALSSPKALSFHIQLSKRRVIAANGLPVMSEGPVWQLETERSAHPRRDVRSSVGFSLMRFS